MKGSMVIEFASVVLVVFGTYFLSVSVFEETVRKTINYKMTGRLPPLIAIFVTLFGYKRKFGSNDLWMGGMLPTSEDVSLTTQFRIIRPLVGFIFILFGSVLQLL